MAKKILRVVGTDVEELKNIVSEVVDNRLQDQDNRKKKEEHINKILKKDEMLREKRETPVVEILKPEIPIVETPKKHEHSCPSCKSSFKKIADDFEICTDCGTTDLKIKKGQKLAICNNCGGLIPESFIGTKNNCPHCDSNAGAHWAK